MNINSKTPASNGRHIENELNLSAEEIEARFVFPYRAGTPLVIRGRTITIEDLDRVRVYQTTRRVDSSQGTPWQEMTEVTSEYITGPPGEDSAAPKFQAEQRPATDTREVFVVHGRNYGARDALFDFLTAIDLHPLEWSEVVQLTGKTMPYIGEILDTAFSNAHAIVVLMTPDDEAKLIDTLQSEKDLPFENSLTGQARPNVLFEAGMAMGRHPERTIIVELGELRPFSDVAGLHVIRLNNTSQRRQELAQRLKTARCPVNLDGIRWHTAGDFDRAIAATNSGDPETASHPEQRLSTAQESQLSEAAKELLTEITRDSSGEIIKFTTSGGFCFRTNGKHFGELGDPRSEARWEGAVRDLLKLGFLTEDPGRRGKLFKVTREGFEAIDDLDKAR